jgi:hypothetical protein
MFNFLVGKHPLIRKAQQWIKLTQVMSLRGEN